MGASGGDGERWLDGGVSLVRMRCSAVSVLVSVSAYVCSPWYPLSTRFPFHSRQARSHEMQKIGLGHL